MAYTYVGIDPSKGEKDISIDSSTTSKAVEISVDSAKVTKAQALALVRHLVGKIETGTWPPA
jgi:hypothetical protein